MDSIAYGLIIFDCDGVLVDSERITARVFAAVLSDFGHPATVDDVFQHFVGKSLDQCLQIIARLYGRPAPEAFVEEYRRQVALALAVEVQAVPGIQAVLDALDQRYAVPFCVASNAIIDKMRITLGATGLLARFIGKMFCVTDVERGKPFPDLFLLAAARFGVEPARCAVIEDTPTGVTAGVAAGMTVYGYCAMTPRHQLVEAGAHRTFERMEQLVNLLTIPV